MSEIMRFSPNPCESTPNDAAIRAMRTEELAQLIDDLLERAPRDIDTHPILDAMTGPLFDAAFCEISRRVPILVTVERGRGNIA